MIDRQVEIFCSGINYKTATIDFREKVFLSAGHLYVILPLLKEKCAVSELLILSTCNRLEVYGVFETKNNLTTNINKLFSVIQSFLVNNKQLIQLDIDNSRYLKKNLHATAHLFSVVASMDSLCVGETQITGQFKKALAIAKDSQTIGPILRRLSQEALFVNKKIRSETSIGKSQNSISHLAIDLAKRLFEDLTKKKFLFIGAGKMIKLAIARAKHYRPQHVFVVNRNYQHALEVTSSMNIGEAYSFDSLSALLLKSDIIVSSTGSEHPIITKSMVKKIQKLRKHKPLYFIDIGLPRDIDSECTKLEEVYLFDIDDLSTSIDEKNLFSHHDIQLAHKIIKAHAQYFQQWLEQAVTKPIICKLKEYLQELFSNEENKTFKKQILTTLPPEQKEAIQSMLQSISNKIIGDAAQILKAKAKEDDFKKTFYSLEDMITKKPSIHSYSSHEETNHEHQ